MHYFNLRLGARTFPATTWDKQMSQREDDFNEQLKDAIVLTDEDQMAITVKDS